MPHVLLRISLACLWLGLCVTSSVSAAEKVKVALFAVPETVWQVKLEGRYRDHADLHARLQERVREHEAERPVEVLCELKHGVPFEWKSGEKRKFTSGWETTGGKPEVKPAYFADRFVGTSVAIKNAEVQHDGALSVELALEHHTAPPAMLRINFANAAEGAERDRLSVEYPQFPTLEWKGEVSLRRGWRLLAQMLYAPEEKKGPVPAQRYLLFITRVIP